jgi:hypothetical protein
MMKSFASIAIVLVFAACSGSKNAEKEEPKQPEMKPPAVSVDGAAKASVTHLLSTYYQVKDALVEYDTAAANLASLSLHAAADGIKTEGISDSALAATLRNFAGNISSESVALVGKKDLVEKKRSFSMISENLYPMLQAVQYNEAVVYHQMCPMAFNDNEAAFWLSNNREIVNPYLGKKHPKYASGMLHCGEVKDSLAYGK